MPSRARDRAAAASSREAEGRYALFLDEIADLPIGSRAACSASEGKGIRPVGGDHRAPGRRPFVAATHRNLSVAVRAGKFTRTLFPPLNVLAIEVPALHAKGERPPSLIQYFF